MMHLSNAVGLRRRPSALLVIAAASALFAPGVRCQETAAPPNDPVAVGVAAAIEPMTEPRVVGMPVYPGAREIATLTLDQPGLRERVVALVTRLGGRVLITRLEAGIYRVPGVIRQDQVMTFYDRELSRERRERGQRATKLGPAETGSNAGISSLPSGQGYVSITVDPDPLQPRDTRVAVVRVEGSPEARALLKPLTEIVCAAHLAGSGAASMTASTTPSGLGALGPRSMTVAAAPLPVFPGSNSEATTRLNAAEVGALIRSLTTARYTPTVRQGIAGLLREARSVTLNLYRVHRPIAGSAVAAYYRTTMAAVGAREVASDTSDPGRPLLVYTLAGGAGVVMIRAYPEPTPLSAYARAPLASPISTTISVLRIDGALLKAP